VGRGNLQLLAHDTAAIAYAKKRTRRWEGPVSKRRVVGPGGDPFVGLINQGSINFLGELSRGATSHHYLRLDLLARAVEDEEC
jgi:hypothetical protein